MHHSFTGDLATRGWEVHHHGGAPKRFQVLGERSSGTNFVKRLIARNTELQHTDALGWKHAAPSMLAVPADMTVVCTFRAADAWARSMHAKPWHCTPALQKLAFSDFIRAPWDTIIDRPRYFPWAEAPEYHGQPLQADRHPLTGEMFGNLFELRQVKLRALLGFLQRHSSCVFLRLETVQNDPEAFLADLRRQLALSAPATPYRPITKRLGSRFKPGVETRPETPAKMSPADYDWMREALDPALEAQIGYSY